MGNRWDNFEVRVIGGNRRGGLGAGREVTAQAMSINSRSPENNEGTVRSTAVSSSDGVLERVRLAINGIRYGEIRVIIQDYVIVQIERVEKERLR